MYNLMPGMLFFSFFSARVCACAYTNETSVCIYVRFSILVPRSHMTITPPRLLCFGLFLNIPCSEVQRVVYRDFPFLRVLLYLTASLSD